MRRDKVALLMVLILFAIVGFAVSCQPKTVIVERRDGEYVQVTPKPTPQFHIVDRGTVVFMDGTARNTFGVYKLVDAEEQQICTVLVQGASYGDSVALSCRPMTLGEITEWK